MNRRGQGISINMVILAAIALVVLIIAILLISKGGKNVNDNTGAKSCLAQGGTCSNRGAATPDGCPSGQKAVDSANTQLNCNDGQICCRVAFE